MSSTTQILFNSPALHSLKRDQLVKLCKIHSIKATGKNMELIEKLKQRAQEMPLDFAQIMPSSDDEASEMTVDGEEHLLRAQLPRPSEQWEIVMDDIEEVEEPTGTVSSKGSLRTLGGPRGEFGTGNTKSSTVSSSLKALATSLGIKRAGSSRSTTDAQLADELAGRSIPYSALPPPDALPQTDHFTFSSRGATPDRSAADADGDISMSAPVPGSPSRPGAPVPANARLSMSKGLTTTIRLISTARDYAPSPPRLAPYQTEFDLDMGPLSADAVSGHHISVWPASPGQSEGQLYPRLPVEDLEPMPQKSPIDSDVQMSVDDDVQIPGDLVVSAPQRTPAKFAKSPMKATPKAFDAPDLFSPASNHRSTAKLMASPAIPRSTPFLFGSPLPQKNTSNKEFGQAAASVLEEMNRRLVEAGTGNIDSRILEKKTSDPFSIFNLPSGPAKADTTDRFAKVHDQAFSKMDSIATHYAARRGVQAPANEPASKKRKSDALGLGPAPGTQRKASAASTRVISNGVRKKMGIPGAFGDEEDDEGEDLADRRSSKRLRAVSGDDVHQGKRVSLAPAREADENAEGTEKAERRKSKEREAIRKKIDARRRSSRGRPSVGRPSIGKAPLAAKGKPSRFGFLSSAKSLVRNVWNMGAGTNATAGKPASTSTSGLPVAKAPHVVAAKSAAESKSAAASSVRKTSDATAAAVKNASHSRTPSVSSSLNTLSKLNAPTNAPRSGSGGTMTSTKSVAGQARHPIPSFALPQSQGGSQNLRAAGSSASGTASSRMSTRIRESTSAGVSSMGTRTSMALNAGGTVTSLGSRRSMAPAASSSARSRMDDNSASKAFVAQAKRTSTLLAPTASSLAKISMPRSRSSNSAKPSTLPVLSEPRSPSAQASTSQSALDTITNSPRSPGTIFSKPFTGFASPPARAEPTPNPSLTAAANRLMGNPPSTTNTSAVPPKPKVVLTRKPRISRTRVMAKAGAQKVERPSVGSPTRALTPRARSSMGRKSLGAVKPVGSTNVDVLKSAKLKKARQSEYTRRKSRAGAGGEDGGNK